jgi:LptD protein
MVSLSSDGQSRPDSTVVSTGGSNPVNVSVPDSIVEEDDLGLDNQIIYTAKDSTILDAVNERILLYGAAEVKYGSMEVKADYIEFSFATFTAKAVGERDSSGHVIKKASFKEGDNEFLEDSLAYNFKSKKGISYGVRTQEGEAYLLTQVSKKASNNWVSIGESKFTTCDKPEPHYYFNLKKAMILPNDKIVSGPVTFGIKRPNTKKWPGSLQLVALLLKETIHIPKIGVPFGFFPNKREAAQGILIPSYGNGYEKGYFLQNLGYYIPVNQNWDTRVLFDVYTRGSWRVKNVTNYKKLYKYSGGFEVSRTMTKIGFSELSSYQRQANFNIQWTHIQDPKARPNTTFSSSVNLGTLNNFRSNINTSQQDYLSSTFTSSVQWAKNFAGTPFNMGLIGGHTQNTQSKTIQVRLPSFTVNMSRISLGRFFEGNPKAKKTMDLIGVNASANIENSLSENDKLFSLKNLRALNRKSKNGMKIQSSASFNKGGKYGTLGASLSGTLYGTVKYLDMQLPQGENVIIADTVTGFRMAKNWNASVNFNSRIYGTFTIKKGKNIKAIRHLVQPTIGLSYTPYSNYRKYGFFSDTGEFMGYSPFDVSQFAPSNSSEAFSATFSVNQNFEAKVRDKSASKITYKKVKIIESWRMSSSYDFMADSLNLKNLAISAFTTLTKDMTIRYSSTYSFYDRDSLGREINTFLASANKGLSRMENSVITLAFKVQSKNKDNLTRADQKLTEEEQKFVEQNQGNLVDFKIPWNINMNYNFRLNRSWDIARQRDKTKMSHTITFDGAVTIAKKYAITVNSGYDLSNMDPRTMQWGNFGLRNFTTTNLGFHWDLHCWEFTFNLVPFGQRKNYSAQFNIKSAMLKDLKVQRRKNLGDGSLLF